MCIERTDPRSRNVAAPEATADTRPRIASDLLMQGARRLVIEHNGEDYVLHVARARRLILTK